MDPISPADRLVALLRQRLAERKRASQTTTAARVLPVDGTDAAEQIQIELPEREAQRQFIQGLLTEQFGAALVHEPKFQLVVDQVTNSISADPKASKLLESALATVRNKAGLRNA